MSKRFLCPGSGQSVITCPGCGREDFATGTIPRHYITRPDTTPSPAAVFVAVGLTLQRRKVETARETTQRRARLQRAGVYSPLTRAELAAQIAPQSATGATEPARELAGSSESHANKINIPGIQSYTPQDQKALAATTGPHSGNLAAGHPVTETPRR